jgi:hypothetical protein
LHYQTPSRGNTMTPCIELQGFSIEFKPWYITVRAPRGRVYLAAGFSKHVPVFTPRHTYLDSNYSTFISNATDYMSEHYDELEEERQYGIYK